MTNYKDTNDAVHHLRFLAELAEFRDEEAAFQSFEEHFKASAEDPYFEYELKLWLTAWRKALAYYTRQVAPIHGEQTMTNNADPVRALIGQWREAAEYFDGPSGLDIRETLIDCADALEAALAQQPTDKGEVEYEYEVWQDGVLQAGGREIDYASAQSEANHYAMMYAQDGPVEVRIYEKRLLITMRREREQKRAVAWARPVYARPVNAPDTGEWDELVDIEFHTRPERPEGEGWYPLVIADTGYDTAPLPRINVRCEYAGPGITGAVYLKVARVEQEDDGSFTAVIER